MRLSDMADTIRRSLTAEQVAKAIGLKPNRAGFCKCPLHGEKTGSMKLYPGSRGWYCFGCHQGGSVIDLVMAYYGMDLRGAIEFLNDEFQMGLPIGYTPTQAQEEEAKRRAAEREQEEKRRKAFEEVQKKAFLQYCDISKALADAENDRIDFAPKSPDEEWDPRFKRALEQIQLLLEEASSLAIVFNQKEET